jgi:hypothetical protein
VRIVGLNKDNVPAWWTKVKDYVEKATVKGPGALSEEELRHGCEKGYYQLWLIIRDPDVIGCGITQIVDEPYRRVLEIVAIGGRELKDWLTLTGMLETVPRRRWALFLSGCSAVLGSSTSSSR